MSQLKLVALDEQDLHIISAHVQDAAMRVGDLLWTPQTGRFLMAMSRFVWENKARFFVKPNERRRSVLHFDRVTAVRTSGFDRNAPDHVLSLLAILFTPGQEPGGTIDLTFAGGAAIQLDVECIEARLADLGAAWEAASRPRHVG